MHQKNNQLAQPSSATLHNDNDEDDDDLKDPFGDGEDDLDEDLDEDDDGTNDIGRGSWWRGVVGKKDRLEDEDTDEDEEFGDFAMAEEEDGREKVLLKPLAVNPAKESSRGLSGLWPFGSRTDKDKPSEKGDDSNDVIVPVFEDKGKEKQQAVEVKEATSRTSIEDAEDEDGDTGAEILVGTRK